jgi:hypothetical protein
MIEAAPAVSQMDGAAVGAVLAQLRGMAQPFASSTIPRAELGVAIRALERIASPAATTASASGESIRAQVDWENGLTKLLEDYKHATDFGINSRETVQEKIIAYVLADRAQAPSREAASMDFEPWLHRHIGSCNAPKFLAHDGMGDNYDEALKDYRAKWRAAVAQQGASHAANAGDTRDAGLEEAAAICIKASKEYETSDVHKSFALERIAEDIRSRRARTAIASSAAQEAK